MEDPYCARLIRSLLLNAMEASSDFLGSNLGEEEGVVLVVGMLSSEYASGNGTKAATCEDYCSLSVHVRTVPKVGRCVENEYDVGAMDSTVERSSKGILICLVVDTVCPSEDTGGVANILVGNNLSSAGR